jgi:uncharacterized protein (TIGR02594 family)
LIYPECGRIRKLYDGVNPRIYSQEENEMHELGDSPSHEVLGKALIQSPWMVPAMRYAGLHLRVVVSDKGQFLRPEDASKLQHFFNLVHHVPMYSHGKVTPWCSAFVNGCMNEAGIPGTNDASARSWMHWGIAARPPYRFGDVAVFGREDRENPYAGHVGFAVGVIPPSRIAVLGGNQRHEVMVRRYPVAKESVGNVGSMWLLGCRRYTLLADIDDPVVLKS